MNKKFYVANWKTYLSHTQAITFCKNHAQELEQLTKNASLIMCPSFTELATIKPLLKNISLGAQNCSSFEAGAHTGDVTAQTLQELCVQYCIIGHSECRKQYHETSQDVAQKALRLLEVGITPILCVSDEHENELKPVFEVLTKSTHLIIAYEPIWAIGTGKTPTNQAIESTLNAIKAQFQTKAPQVTATLLYGGSVAPETIQELKKITTLDGFLIGKASTDFQKLKNIVE